MTTCPHCAYGDEIRGDLVGFFQGEYGDFYIGNVLTRQNPKHATLKDTATEFGCPSCGKTFIVRTSEY